MKSKFKVGDIVQLKSGGPKMTIKRIESGMMDKEPIFCQWFAGSKLQDGWFNEDSVIMAKKDDN